MHSRFLMLLLLPIVAYANPKKTICMLTINSSDEKEVFMQSLPKDQFNFVELADFEQIYKKDLKPQLSGERPHWLSAACKAKLTCDALVISGHFAGSFFGKSGLRIHLDEMEKLSCDPSCDGIFHHPKEVYLFGCNTLAGKTADSRTPEQYRQALLDDNIPNFEAEMMVAYRYSALGDSFGDRMMNVFAGVPKIYGFNSKAPLGNVSGPLLARYLNKSKMTYATSLNDSFAFNDDLLKIFSKSSMIQARGSELEARGSTIACFIQRQNSDSEKLKWFSKALESGRVLEVSGHLLNYLESLKSRNVELGGEARQYLNLMKKNTSAQAQVVAMLKTLALPAVQTTLANLAREFDWLSDPQYQDWIMKTFFYEGFDFSSDDYEKHYRINQTFYRACSYKVRLHLSFDRVPSSLLKNYNFVSLINCINPSDIRFQHAYKKLLKDAYLAKDESDLTLYLDPFYNMGKGDDELIEQLFQIVGDKSIFSTSREKAITILHHVVVGDLSSAQKAFLIDLLKDSVWSFALDVLRSKTPKDRDFLIAFIGATRGNLYFHAWYEYVFQGPFESATIDAVKKLALESNDPVTKKNAQKALGYMLSSP